MRLSANKRFDESATEKKLRWDHAWRNLVHTYVDSKRFESASTDWAYLLYSDCCPQLLSSGALRLDGFWIVPNNVGWISAFFQGGLPGLSAISIQLQRQGESPSSMHEHGMQSAMERKLDQRWVHARSLSYHVRSCTTSRTSMRSTRPVAVLSCPVVHDPTPWPKLRELDSARTGHAHLNNQVQPQRRGRVMLVPTKIDLTVDAERHKTFKVPPFLQALEHSSDCERSSQRVEKKSSISSIKNTGKAQTPSPPKRACPFLGKWRNLGTVPNQHCKERQHSGSGESNSALQNQILRLQHSVARQEHAANFVTRSGVPEKESTADERPENSDPFSKHVRICKYISLSRTWWKSDDSDDLPRTFLDPGLDHFSWRQPTKKSKPG